MNQKISQEDRILQYLKDGVTLTVQEAEDNLGIRFLNIKIYDLREQGYIIKDEWDISSEGKRCKRYSWGVQVNGS